MEQVSPEVFDWASEDGPAAAVRRIARASTAYDGTSTLNEQAVLQLKNRGLRGAQLWVSDVSTGSTSRSTDSSGSTSRSTDSPGTTSGGGATSGAGGFALRHNGVLDLAVHPDSRRQGIGTALAAEAAPAGLKVDAWSHCDHPGAARLAEKLRVPRERDLVIMRRPLTAPLGEVVTPDGVTIRRFRPGDESALIEVNATAFAHHPEQGEMTLDDFRERMSEAWFDPAGLFLAVPSDPAPDDPPLLGFHWTKEHRDEDPAYGEVYVVAVNPKAAGRGLGTVLTAAGLQHLRDRGLESVLLYVDGDNDPAIAVYTRQGFEVERTEVQYRGTSAGLPA